MAQIKSNEKNQAFQSAHDNINFAQTKIERVASPFEAACGGKPAERWSFVKKRILRLMKAFGSHRLEALSAIF